MAEQTEKKEPWLNYLALATVLLAVCATLATFRGGGYSTRAVLNQSHAANQWAYYQAKSIKGYLYEVQKDKLELERLALGGKVAKPLAEGYEKRIAFYGQNIKRYEDEKAQIQKDARQFEALRDDAATHARVFGVAVIFLQIAILMSSIAALMKKRILWVAGLGLGLVGVVYFADGFFLFLPPAYVIF
jgi:hypothetical protein